MTAESRAWLAGLALPTAAHELITTALVMIDARNRRRLGKQRGAKVAQIDIARKLTEAIWHMLTRNEPFAPTTAPGGAAFRLAARRPFRTCAPAAGLPFRLVLPLRRQ